MVKFHLKDAFLDTANPTFKIYPNNWTDITVSTWEITKVLSKTENNKLTCYPDHHYDDYVYAYLTAQVKNLTRSEGGCTSPWLKDGPEWSTKICQKVANVQAINNQKNISRHQIGILPPCTTLFLYKDTDTLPSRGTSGLTITFPNRMIVVKESTYYTSQDLFADIGGSMGATIGISVLTFSGWLRTGLEIILSKMGG